MNNILNLEDALVDRYNSTRFKKTISAKEEKKLKHFKRMLFMFTKNTQPIIQTYNSPEMFGAFINPSHFYKITTTNEKSD